MYSGRAIYDPERLEFLDRDGQRLDLQRRFGPDDDPEFLRRIAHDQEREERIRKLEEKLAELDDDNPKD